MPHCALFSQPTFQNWVNERSTSASRIYLLTTLLASKLLPPAFSAWLDGKEKVKEQDGFGRQVTDVALSAFFYMMMMTNLFAGD